MPAEPQAAPFRPGDVLWYARERDHAREGTALVGDNGVAADTFWWPFGGCDSHILTSAELATAEVRFNVNDYEPLDRYSPASRPKWMTYHPEDRGRITSQHGLQEALFVRRGARPCLATQIANARTAVEAAEAEVRAAESRLADRRRSLAELEAVSVNAR